MHFSNKCALVLEIFIYIGYRSSTSIVQNSIQDLNKNLTSISVMYITPQECLGIVANMLRRRYSKTNDGINYVDL